MDAWINIFGVEQNGVKSLTTSRQSLVVSILSAGTFFGALSAGPLADKIGRKWGMVASCIVFSLGVGVSSLDFG